MKLNLGGNARFSGQRTHEIRRGNQAGGKKLTLWQRIAAVLPSRKASPEINRYRRQNFWNTFRGLRQLAAAQIFGTAHALGTLTATLTRGDGTVIDYGVVSYRVVTDDGVEAIVDAFQNLAELEDFKYHGYGTGTTAEAATDAALVTELTTEYSPNATRPTGSQTEGATANIYRTVATLTPDSGGVIAITEHAIFDQAATGGGVMLDRSVFAAMNLDSANGDNLQTTYDFEVVSGG